MRTGSGRQIVLRIPASRTTRTAPRSRIRIEERKLRLLSDDGIGQTLNLQEIVRVTVYKLDLYSYDLICCEIAFEDEGGEGSWTLDEQMDGFKLCMTWLEGLPDFESDWFWYVAFPAFETNPKVLFQRTETK